MYTRQSIDLIKQRADPKDVLSIIGGVSLNNILDTGDEVRSICPLHNGDNKTAFKWKRSTGYWTCYTHDCGKGTKHDLFDFVKLKLNISFIEAVELLARTFGVTLEQGNPEVVMDNTYIKNSLKEFQSIKKYEISNLKELTWLPGYHKEGFDLVLKYLQSRRYTPEDIKIFNFYPQLDNLNILRMGIPVYDEDGKLVGINARLMDTVITYPQTVEVDGKSHPVPKYRMTPFSKGSVLYNLNNARGTSLQNGIIVVEGQLDVARLRTYGINNTVCTMGTTLSAKQVALLYKYCFHTIFLVEEGEPAIQGVLKSIKQLNTMMKVSIAKLPSGDADSNPKEVVLDTLKSAKVLSVEELKELCNND